MSRINQVNYDAVASTPTSNVARATVSLTVENKGHTQSKETTYKVVLPLTQNLFQRLALTVIIMRIPTL